MLLHIYMKMSHFSDPKELLLIVNEMKLCKENFQKQNGLNFPKS